MPNRVSFVIPVHNEEATISRLIKDLVKEAQKLKLIFEILVVDDGSTDQTIKKLHSVKSKYPHLTVISLRKRFGQTAALVAGFDQSKYPIIITLDGDLQNDPKDIGILLSKIDEGYDLVSGWRKDRQDEYVLRILPSKIANFLISIISGVSLHDFGCSLKAYRKEILDEINLYGEMHRFIPAVASTVGARIIEVPVTHHPREYGQSKYGIGRTIRVILDVILVKFLLSYQTRPLQLFGRIGLVTGGVGFVVFMYLLYERLILHQPLADRPLFLVTIFLMLVGIQFITFGILAEMLMRVYFESQGKKIYSVKKVV